VNTGRAGVRAHCARRTTVTAMKQEFRLRDVRRLLVACNDTAAGPDRTAPQRRWRYQFLHHLPLDGVEKFWTCWGRRCQGLSVVRPGWFVPLGVRRLGGAGSGADRVAPLVPGVCGDR